MVMDSSRKRRNNLDCSRSFGDEIHRVLVVM